MYDNPLKLYWVKSKLFLRIVQEFYYFCSPFFKERKNMDLNFSKAGELIPEVVQDVVTDTGYGESNQYSGIQFLEYLQDFIYSRQKEMPKGSYTTKLFESGINKIAQKVGEEAVELVIEAKDQNDELFLNEAADLMYHFIVLLTAKGYSLKDVTRVLKERHK